MRHNYESDSEMEEDDWNKYREDIGTCKKEKEDFFHSNQSCQYNQRSQEFIQKRQGIPGGNWSVWDVQENQGAQDWKDWGVQEECKSENILPGERDRCESWKTQGICRYVRKIYKQSKAISSIVESNFYILKWKK